MERVIDLDEAAALVAERAARWRSVGLAVGQPTWRDEAASWPYPLETDRSRVGAPDTLGVAVSGPLGAELAVVLYRGGWADVDYYDGADEAGMLPASDMVSATDFASRLDQWALQVFGPAAGTTSPLWVDSLGGPLVVVPRSALSGWHGGTASGLTVGGDALDDYDRACAVDDLAAVITLAGHSAEALVLADEPATTCYLQEHHAFVRWLAADSAADLLAAAETVLADPATAWE